MLETSARISQEKKGYRKLKIETNVVEFPRRLMGVAGAACYLAQSKSKIRQMAWNREIPYVQEKPHGRMLFDKEDLDRWIDEHRVAC